LDTKNGVFVISHNARDGSFQGMVFTLLGPEGQILPGRPDDLYKLVETSAPVSHDANYHDVKYDPRSGSFLIIYSTGDGFTDVVKLTVRTNYLPASTEHWSIY